MVAFHEAGAELIRADGGMSERLIEKSLPAYVFFSIWGEGRFIFLQEAAEGMIYNPCGVYVKVLMGVFFNLVTDWRFFWRWAGVKRRLKLSVCELV